MAIANDGKYRRRNKVAKIIFWKCLLCGTGQWELQRLDSTYKCVECKEVVVRPISIGGNL